jgi:hypothetical protein
MDGLRTTSVDIGQKGQQHILYDLGEPYRLEAYSVLGDSTQACVRATQLQYAKSLDAPDSEWHDSGPDLDVVQSETSFSTSRRFEPPVASRYWRLVIRGNYDDFKVLFYSVISEVQVRSFHAMQAVPGQSTRMQLSSFVNNTKMVLQMIGWDTHKFHAHVLPRVGTWLKWH